MTMKAKVDCTTSQLVVRSFIDFLNSVEPTPGADMGPLEVAKNCLVNMFKLDDGPSHGNQSNPSLVGMLEYLDLCESKKIVSDLKSAGFPIEESSVDDVAYADPDSDSDSSSDSKPPIILDEEESQDEEELTSKLSTIGFSNDEIDRQYFAAVEEIKRMYSAISMNDDDPVEVAKVTRIFQENFTMAEFKLATPKIPKEPDVPVEDFNEPVQEEAREPAYTIHLANPTARDLVYIRRSLISAGVPTLRVRGRN